MKYLESKPMFFGYGKGQESKPDPAKCPHPKTSYRGGAWFCSRCGKEMR